MRHAKANLLGQARTLATDIVNDPLYLADVKRRAIAGELPPQMEVMLWNYAYGKPIDTIEVIEPDRELEGLSNTQLAGMARELEQELLERGQQTAPGVH